MPGASTYFLYFVDGLTYGFLLFILALGLSVVFGLLDIVNLAHGSFYALASYLTFSLVTAHFVSHGGFWVSVVCVPLAVGLLGLCFEGALLRRTYHHGFLVQVLVTFGFAFIASDLFLSVWGGSTLSVQPPDLLKGSAEVWGYSFPVYRLFVGAVGLVVAVIFRYVLRRTIVGDVLKAMVDDREMLAMLGYDIRHICRWGFAVGAALAGLAGVIGVPILSVGPGTDSAVLITALIVVVVGGLGNFDGVLAGALLVGESATFGVVLLPQISVAILYVIMALILLIRPTGLGGFFR
jgi:branched-chain amino acid transport system permease protein